MYSNMIVTAVQPVLLYYIRLDLTQYICRLDLQSSGNLSPFALSRWPLYTYTHKIKLYTATDLKPHAKMRSIERKKGILKKASHDE